MDDLLNTCKQEVALQGKQHVTAACPKDKLVFKFFCQSPEIQTLRKRGGPGDSPGTWILFVHWLKTLRA